MRRWGLLALAAALLAYPWLVNGSDSAAFLQDTGALVLLAAVGASAWNIVGGYAGQISVGHAMFFGAGAYLPLLVYQHWQWSPLIGVPLGVAVSLVIAVFIGFPTFRLVGHYFSMATIAVAELARIIVGNWDFVGAAIGLQGPATGRGWYDVIFRSSVPYYYIFLAALVLVLLVTWGMQQSRLGYYLGAIRAGERAARSLGVPVRRYKLYALMLSAGFTSLAGSLYALKTGFIDPDSGLGILVSVQMIITAALGGAGTLFGPLLGAAILVPLQTATNTWLGGSGSGLTFIVYGGVIVFIARFEPGGLLEMWQRLLAARRGRRSEARHAA
jgi:branched-chain amino acid transport system permease protein